MNVNIFQIELFLCYIIYSTKLSFLDYTGVI